MGKIFLISILLLLQSYGEAPKSYKNVRLDFKGLATHFPYYNVRAFPNKGHLDFNFGTDSCKKYRVPSSMLAKLYQRDFEYGMIISEYPCDSFHYYSWQPKLGNLHILTIHSLIEEEYDTKINCLI